MKLQYFLKMNPPPPPPFSAPEGCFGRICWLHGSHSSDKRGNWFLHYSIPPGHNRSPVDKDGLDLTFVNIQMFVHSKWGTRNKEGEWQKSPRHVPLLPFCTQNKLASSSSADFSEVCVLATGRCGRYLNWNRKRYTYNAHWFMHFPVI